MNGSNAHLALTLMWLLEKVIAPRATTSTSTKQTSRNPNYSQRAIASEIQKLAGTSVNRNNQLNDSAMAIGQFVGAGEMARTEAEKQLYGAAVANGYVVKDGEAAARLPSRVA